MDILRECAGARSIGIASHIRPDGDAVGSCMALFYYLQKMLPNARLQLYLERPADAFGELKGLMENTGRFEREGSPDVFFCLDCEKSRLGEAEPIFEKAVKTINIDHHISNRAGCGNVNVVLPQASSTCEVLYGLLQEEMLDRDIAMALYIGIIHDCGVFQYSNTSPQTLEIAASLIKYGFPFPRLIEETFYQKTYLQTQLMGRILMESIRLMDGKCVAACADRKLIDFYGARPLDFDGIVNQLRNIKGVECAVFMYETALMEYKVSMRSGEKVDVSRIASYFGGGGHVRAAGCTMKGTFHDVVNNLAVQIEEQLQEAP